MTYITPNANGPAPSTSSTPTVLAAQNVAGVSRATPALNYEFFTNSTNGWFGVLSYAWVSFTIQAGAGITSGHIVFEQTNDTASAAAGVPMQMQDESVLSVQRVTTISLSPNTTYQYSGPITARYIRVRVSNTITGGSVSLGYTLKQAAPQLGYQAANVAKLSGSTGSLGSVNLATGTKFAGLINPPLGSAVVDSTYTGLTGNGSFGTTYLTTASEAAITMAISSLTGTTPTLDMTVQETYDGTSFYDIYHFDRLTSAATVTSPPLHFNGIGYRCALFTLSSGATYSGQQIRTNRPSLASNCRVYYDRQMHTNSTGFPTSPFLSHGATQYTLIVNTSGTSSPACIMALQLSNDDTNWWSVATLTSVAGTNAIVQTTVTGVTGRWVRCAVTTAGTGVTLNYVQITAGQ